MVASRQVFLCLALVLLLAPEALSQKHHHKKKPKLRRMIVLGRHGNRAPNAQVVELCPTFTKEVLPKFEVPTAALSKVGMAENWENGNFLKDKLKELDIEEDEKYNYDGTFSFFSERMDRNIVSTEALALGMFPEGTGIKGFMGERPNLVPIATTQAHVDELMNCPRDGPCKPVYKADFAKWVADNEARIYNESKAVFDRVYEACGIEPITAEGFMYQGEKKPLTWAAKAIGDIFSFTANEGLDATIGGRITAEEVAAFKHVVNGMVSGTRFSKNHQLTYWVSDFLPTVFKLSKMPLKGNNKFHLFLNHRELIYASAHMLGLSIQFPDAPPDVLPSGCALIFEVYDEGLKMYWWAPSRPSFDQKKWANEKGVNMQELYDKGITIPTSPTGCTDDEICPLDKVEEVFNDFTKETGTYKEICGIGEQTTQAELYARGYETQDFSGGNKVTDDESATADMAEEAAAAVARLKQNMKNGPQTSTAMTGLLIQGFLGFAVMGTVFASLFWQPLKRQRMSRNNAPTMDSSRLLG